MTFYLRQIVACTALFFSILHSVGHLCNFYHVSTQPLEHLHCLSPEFRFSSDKKVDIAYWLFQTLTGGFGDLLGTGGNVPFIFARI